ncbi:hypothetical protein Hdeb2414_s0012g00390251 [Helianthus debilis subsp. tardiflorus]
MYSPAIIIIPFSAFHHCFAWLWYSQLESYWACYHRVRLLPVWRLHLRFRQCL